MFNQHQYKKHNKSKGFSLIELLVALAIFGILVTFAAPHVKDAITTRKITKLTESTFTSLKLAQNEALNKGMPVMVCSSSVNDDKQECEFNKDWTTGLSLVKGKAAIEKVMKAQPNNPIPDNPAEPRPPRAFSRRNYPKWNPPVDMSKPESCWILYDVGQRADDPLVTSCFEQMLYAEMQDAQDRHSWHRSNTHRRVTNTFYDDNKDFRLFINATAAARFSQAVRNGNGVGYVRKSGRWIKQKKRTIGAPAGAGICRVRCNIDDNGMRDVIFNEVMGKYRDSGILYGNGARAAQQRRDAAARRYQEDIKRYNDNYAREVSKWNKAKAAWEAREDKRFRDEWFLYEQKLAARESIQKEWDDWQNNPYELQLNKTGDLIHRVNHNAVNRNKFKITNLNYPVLIFSREGGLMYFDHAAKKLRHITGVTKIKINDVSNNDDKARIICINVLGNMHIVRGNQECNFSS